MTDGAWWQKPKVYVIIVLEKGKTETEKEILFEKIILSKY